jgi:hypothetical protein
VHQLELFGGAVGGLPREGPTLLLGHHTGVVELLDVVNARHPEDHLLLAKMF